MGISNLSAKFSYISFPFLLTPAPKANVLVGDDRRAILCDFGLSRISNELSTDQTSSVMGATPRWTAPEVIFDEKKTVKGDIYSFACTCIQVSLVMISPMLQCLHETLNWPDPLRPTTFPQPK